MSFLPENYKSPEGNYMRLQDGENTFRVLSHAITGWEYWNKDSKPVRLKVQPQTLPKDIRVEEGKNPTIKHFWAFLVYNYKAEKQQILEITQSSIQNFITNLIKNKAWGAPQDYDITITRTGSGFDTEYSVMPNPKTPCEIKPITVHLEKLFEGGDPFELNAEDVNF